MADSRVAKLLVSTALLTLEPEGAPKLDLELAWNMRAVITIETYLRTRFGQEINILQNPGSFWSDMDCTKLALGVWACSMQKQPQYETEEGFEIIQSYLTPDNYPDAMDALRKSYLESLSTKKRNEVVAAIEEAKRKVLAGEKPADPIVAQTQAST